MGTKRLWEIVLPICCACGALILMLVILPAGDVRAGTPEDFLFRYSLVQAEGASKLGIVENVLSGLYLPRQTGEEFNGILLRNRPEMEAIVSENPFLVWDTMTIIVGAMPYLKEVEHNGGRLYLDRDTYSNTVNLLIKYQAVASPKFAADLQLLKEMFDGRIKSLDTEGLWIDLN
jgi:hypothetical protein